MYKCIMSKLREGVTFGPQRGRGGYKGSRGDLLNRIWLKGGGLEQFPKGGGKSRSPKAQGGHTPSPPLDTYVITTCKV